MFAKKYLESMEKAFVGYLTCTRPSEFFDKVRKVFNNYAGKQKTVTLKRFDRNFLMYHPSYVLKALNILESYEYIERLDPRLKTFKILRKIQ